MRLLVALLWLLSLLGMQAHCFAPHHDHHDFVADHVHSESERPEASPDAQLTHDHHHQHSLHDHLDHLDHAEVRTQRSPRTSPDLVAILPLVTSFSFTTRCPADSRISHPFVPFQTGPPGVVASRGPPIPVA